MLCSQNAPAAASEEHGEVRFHKQATWNIEEELVLGGGGGQRELVRH